MKKAVSIVLKYVDGMRCSVLGEGLFRGGIALKCGSFGDNATNCVKITLEISSN